MAAHTKEAPVRACEFSTFRQSFQANMARFTSFCAQSKEPTEAQPQVGVPAFYCKFALRENEKQSVVQYQDTSAKSDEDSTLVLKCKPAAPVKKASTQKRSPRAYETKYKLRRKQTNALAKSSD